jgi:hypothetical protein
LIVKAGLAGGESRGDPAADEAGVEARITDAATSAPPGGDDDG